MTRFTRLLTGLLALLCVAASWAQPTSPQTRRPPQIWLDPALGKLQPIVLSSMHIDVRSTGFLASTSVELSFFNPNDRVLEGELVFPLSSGQSLTGYALEVDGKLRQGVVVPKETARVAFEEITRRGIDPGLAELTRGNVFRTRLYPIPARGHKRVRFSFDQPLLDDGAEWRYVLPLEFTQKLERFSVRAEAVLSEQAPKSHSHPGTLGFAKVRHSHVAELSQTDVMPQRELSFSVPKSTRQSNSYKVVDPLEPAWHTLSAQVDTGLPQTLQAVRSRHIALFYDASGSAAKRDRQRERQLLAQWLQTQGKVRVDLIPFRDAADKVQRFDLSGNADALLAAIDQLPIDGGSSYGAIDLGLAAGADTVLVIGDGLSNFASATPALQRKDGSSPRLILLHAAQSVDSQALSRLARRHGGILLDLLQLNPQQALERIAQPRWSLLSARTTAGECVDMAPLAPQPVNRHFVFHARCKQGAIVQLLFGDGSNAQHEVRRELRLDQAVALEGDSAAAVPRLWATALIADIEARQGADDPRITRLATEHGVVTANTSMLVLDRIEDYVRYRVRPAEPELQAQYQHLLGQQSKQVQTINTDRAHLDTVLAQWRNFRDWHQRRHPWLETLLQPSVAAELKRWDALKSDPRLAPMAAAQLARLHGLQTQASELERRWAKEGSGDRSRASWEREAVRVMLAMDQIRIQRLTAWPESDSVDGRQQQGSAPSGGAAAEQLDSVVMMAMPAPAPATELAEAAPAAAFRTSARPSTSREEAPKQDADAIAGGNDAAVAAPAARARIELAAWNPDTPYLAKLRAARDPYQAYLRERQSQGDTPAFFLDCADYFRNEVKNQALALRILSNLAEMDTESAPLVRVLAYRLGHWERFDLAIPLFETALKLRGEEPQSRRDLALALSRAAQPDYPRAIGLLWEVVSRPWDGRFPEIGVIALHELNDILARMPAAASAALDLAALGVEPAFVEQIPVDLRVVLSWDADNTDIDLWVIDPTGEVAIYSHPQTRSGGQMSRDFTGGYGPEVYTISRAIPGTYIVKAHYFGDRVQKLTGAVTVQVEFLTDFSRPGSSRQAVTRRLEGDDATMEVGRFVAEFK